MTENIKLTFLGTSDAIPTSTRNHPAILLTYNGENILIDCGEGTQRQFRKARLNPCRLTRILLTHWHADHILGIPGILKTLGLSGYNKKLSVYGPKKTKFFMQELLKIFAVKKYFFMDIKEVSGKFFETKDFYLKAESMTHSVPCNAYSFVKKGRIRIDKKKLRKSGLPHGKLLQKLKEGKNVIYMGKKYLAKNLTFKEKEKKISFVLDTSINKKIPSFAKNSDILVCEASFGSELENKAREYKHLTAKQAAKIAKKSNSKKLILTHISQRYSRKPEKILNEAKKIFKNSSLAHDLEVIEI